MCSVETMQSHELELIFQQLETSRRRQTPSRRRQTPIRRRLTLDRCRLTADSYETTARCRLLSTTDRPTVAELMEFLALHVRGHDFFQLGILVRPPSPLQLPLAS